MRILAPCGICVLLLPSLAWAANPDWYVLEETWQATMRASLEAFDRGRTQEPGDREFEPFLSDVTHGGQTAQRVVVSTSGVQRLTLIASGVPDYSGAHADWGAARLVAKDGAIVYLSDLEPVRASQPYGRLQRDRSHRGGPIRIAGREFARGLSTHAFSELCFALDGKYERFEAWIGVDETAGTAGGVRFIVTNQPDAEIEAVRGAR